MRKYLLLLLIVVASPASTAESALRPEPRNINECAQLLPKGNTYSFTISGTIDTTKTKAWLVAKTTLAEDSKTEPPPGDMDAFAACLNNLVGK